MRRMGPYESWAALKNNKTRAYPAITIGTTNVTEPADVLTPARTASSWLSMGGLERYRSNTVGSPGAVVQVTVTLAPVITLVGVLKVRACTKGRMTASRLTGAAVLRHRHEYAPRRKAHLSFASMSTSTIEYRVSGVAWRASWLLYSYLA
jgi:hypothetical protein